MQCPQCGAETPDDQWNCVSCRINLYWASQHYAELAAMRAKAGLDTQTHTPPFLVNVSKRELGERDQRGGPTMNKVREIARRVMRGESAEQP
ncbi:MAG: hypothetical protein OJF49_002544 [Ktedonobacterales bacterium]|jgi:hypothetical protein|nr:MAG: hypothetical protein OJF49_002544 [Ktedonobacterales bacterium]